ncbi:putative lipoprotein [Trichinella spiralis]|uniref:Lipoprotein n=1 Tax=Trichinella spiralis TaxID=6334 RepID=A0ABR3L032_TRISP
MINSSRAQFSALGWAALELGENKRFPLVTAEQQGRGCGVEPNLNGPTNNFDFQFAKTTPTSGRHILAYSDEPLVKLSNGPGNF